MNRENKPRARLKVQSRVSNRIGAESSLSARNHIDTAAPLSYGPIRTRVGQQGFHLRRTVDKSNLLHSALRQIGGHHRILAQPPLRSGILRQAIQSR